VSEYVWKVLLAVIRFLPMSFLHLRLTTDAGVSRLKKHKGPPAKGLVEARNMRLLEARKKRPPTKSSGKLILLYRNLSHYMVHQKSMHLC